jgi:RNA polymerase primary sigma factor
MRHLKINKQVTIRESASTEIYLRVIGNTALLIADEEAMVRKSRSDWKAFEILVNSNLNFVVSEAKQYQNQGLTLHELICEVNLGLIKAAELFDENRGFKFLTYAGWWIRQAILQAIAEQSRIERLCLNKMESFNKINKTFIQLEQDFQHEPTVEELNIA